MNTSETERFEEHWSDFIRKLKGQISRRAKDGTLSYQRMNMLLKHLRLDWAVPETRGGNWLTQLSKTEPDKAKEIEQILVHDMEFQELAPARGIPAAAQAAVPVAGGAAGYVVSDLLLTRAALAEGTAVQGAALIQLGSTLGPAAILLGSLLVGNRKLLNKRRESVMQAYMEQLEKYHQSVLSILEQCDQNSETGCDKDLETDRDLTDLSHRA